MPQCWNWCILLLLLELVGRSQQWCGRFFSYRRRVKHVQTDGILWTNASKKPPWLPILSFNLKVMLAPCSAGLFFYCLHLHISLFSLLSLLPLVRNLLFTLTLSFPGAPPKPYGLSAFAKMPKYVRMHCVETGKAKQEKTTRDERYHSAWASRLVRRQETWKDTEM